MLCEGDGSVLDFVRRFSLDDWCKIGLDLECRRGDFAVWTSSSLKPDRDLPLLWNEDKRPDCDARRVLTSNWWYSSLDGPRFRRVTGGLDDVE